MAFKEVEDALVAVQTAREQRQAQIEQVEALRSALRLANLRYRGGLTSYIDVLIAKRNLFDAELSLTERIACIWFRSCNCIKPWVEGGRQLFDLTPYRKQSGFNCRYGKTKGIYPLTRQEERQGAAKENLWQNCRTPMPRSTQRRRV